MTRSLRLPWVTALLATLLVLGIFWENLPFNQPQYEPVMDRGYYLQIAQGRLHEVIKPFSKRVLHPVSASALSKSFRLSLDQAFFILALVSVFLLVGSLASIFKVWISREHVWFVIPMIMTPYLGLLFYDYYMHDLFFSALLGLFFLCLSRDRFEPALLLLFLLFLAREATLLLGLVLLAVSVWRKERRRIVGYALVVAAGVAVSSYVGSLSPSNRHQLGEALFMVLKIGYNIAANFFGVNLWANTYGSCEPLLEWQLVKAPSWFPLGSIRAVGVCGFEEGQPVHTLYRYLTVFGIGPSVLLALAPNARNLCRRSETWLMIACVYGLASYLLGPALGPGGFRLMGYGWPAFWIAAAVLSARAFAWDRRSGLILLACHLVLAWLPEGTQAMRWNPVVERAIILGGAIALQIAAFRILLRLRRASSVPATTASS